MAFYDYGEPIRNIVDRYFEKKRLYSTNTVNNPGIAGKSLIRGEAVNEILPDLPCQILRDENGRVWRVIYGESGLLDSGEECDPIVWQEEILRDENGRVTGFVTTYPDGETVTTRLLRAQDGKLSRYTF